MVNSVVVLLNQPQLIFLAFLFLAAATFSPLCQRHIWVDKIISKASCVLVRACECRSYMAAREMWPICGRAAVIPSTWGSWRVKEGESSLTTRRGLNVIWKCSQKVADGETFEQDPSALTFSIKKNLCLATWFVGVKTVERTVAAAANATWSAVDLHL